MQRAWASAVHASAGHLGMPEDVEGGVKKDKKGRKLGDRGKKKTEAVSPLKTATNDALKAGAHAVKKLEEWSSKNNREGAGGVETGWGLSVFVKGGVGAKKAKLAPGVCVAGGGAAALTEPGSEAVAACFGGTNPAEVA